MVRHAITRQTLWYKNRFSTFKIKKIIVENPFGKIFEFWPLVTSILTWAKKWTKWFLNDFSRAFERCLSFFSTTTRSRDHGRRSNAPPQQAVENPGASAAERGLTPEIGAQFFFTQLSVAKLCCMLRTHGRHALPMGMYVQPMPTVRQSKGRQTFFQSSYSKLRYSPGKINR